MSTAVSYQCSAQQGFAFQPATHQQFGYVKQLAIASLGLGTDLTVWDDTSTVLPAAGVNAPTTHIAAVLEAVQWSGGQSDPISVACYVSPANHKLLADYLLQAPTSTSVGMAVVVHSYDPVQTAYFPAFYGTSGTVPTGYAGPRLTVAPLNTPVYGLVARSSSGWSLQLGNSAVQVNPTTTAYHLTVTVAPAVAATSQILTVQSSPAMKVARAWGAVAPAV
jgi:hypothetical protein